MIPAVVGIPIKPFGVAKQRLSPVLDAKQRSVLGRAVAARTASMLALSGAVPVVVTSDEEVARWAKSLHLEVVPEAIGGRPGLDRAARTLADAAGGEAWAIVHADLPLATANDFIAVWDGLGANQAAIAPAHDGGTNVVAACGPLAFSYGPGSFARHRTALPHAAVTVRTGLAYDLDTPGDLALMRALDRGAWLRSVLEVIEASPGAR